MRRTRKCIKCGGVSYLRTSHHKKVGTWRCLSCRDVIRDYDYRIYPNIKLCIKCKCGENLKIQLVPNIEERIPYCSIHGKLNSF